LSFQGVWPWLAGAAHVIVTVVVSAHVILHKRDVRAAIGWCALIFFSPYVGALAYYFFGINRIQRRAARLIALRPELDEGALAPARPTAPPAPIDEELDRLSRTVGRATGNQLLPCNAVRTLVNGDEAYPEMLEAIARAERSVLLTTYIFDHDRAGDVFLDALSDAALRGVEVRVLVDAVGKRYSRPRITRALRARNIRTAEFLPSRVPFRNPYVNMRNHRKLLIVDGRTGFAGGLNIREGCLLKQPSSHPVQDLHFRFEGPIVDQMFSAAHQDWYFTTGELLGGPAWHSATTASGDVWARGLPDGPDEDFETILWTLLAAVGAARRSIRIATPYFLPDLPTLTALRLAAYRGVEVDILLPEKNNLRFVGWASRAQLWQVLEPGCRVWLVPSPFDHSKVMVVDGAWSLVGSANWDARSLRLNFEYNVECYDEVLADELMRLTGEKMERSRSLSLEEVDARPLPARLRDGTARLLAPYL
jgi:cardiolipin synthase